MGGQMLLNTLFFEEEITANPAKTIKESGTEAELKMAKALIEGMSGKFNPTDYKDEYRRRVQEAIERKIAGKEIVTPKDSGTDRMIDLMEALTKSLELTQKPKALKRTAAKRTSERKKE